MNLQQPNANEVSQTANRSRSVVPGSGICTRCIDGCKGNCEIFKATMRGREVVYPGPFGTLTAGADKDYPVDYSHLNICGYALGAEGLPDGEVGDPDNTLFPMVDTETEYGAENKVKMRLPVFTGALGSTDIARTNWEQFAAGAAISGITLVCGENVCGIDPGLELDSNGKIVESPEMRRRVDTYKKWYEGYGDLVVQMNVEDTRFGVAEYVVGKLGVKTVELKWGQGAKCIGGEIKTDSLERALELKNRGYLITPDPSEPAVQAAVNDGAIKQFERHSRLGFVDGGGLREGGRAAAQARRRARDSENGRLPHARARDGDQVVTCNHYVGRTFIMPAEDPRGESVEIKLNAVQSVVSGKRVVVVDDSIIRGTTSRRRFRLLRDTGAREIHVRISAPPCRFPCFYGIDFPSHGELIAASRSVEEIRAFLGVDSLGYQTVEGLVSAVARPDDYCAACFTGEYPEPISEKVEKLALENPALAQDPLRSEGRGAAAEGIS